MMNSMFLIFGVVLILALVSFFSQVHNFLMVLLSFEAAVLSLALMNSIMYSVSWDVFSGLVILTFGACEAAVGLALLVLLSRGFGNDLLSQLTLNKC